MARSAESKKAGKEIAKQISFQRKMIQAQTIEKEAERLDQENRMYARSRALDNEIDKEYDNINFIISVNISIERRGYVEIK